MHAKRIRPPDFRLGWKFVSKEPFAAYDASGTREVIGEYRWYINERTAEMGYEIWQTGSATLIGICWESKKYAGQAEKSIHHFAYYGTEWNIFRVMEPMVTAEIRRLPGGIGSRLRIGFNVIGGGERTLFFPL